MNRDEAKYILGAYRADGEDQGDPQFAEALVMVQRDPELARWFAAEQAMDGRLARSFATFPVPADLKTQLLAARAVIVVPLWKRPAGWLAAAAALAILLGIAVSFRTLRTRPPLTASFPEEILRFAADGPHATDTLTSLSDTRQWLAANGLPAQLPLSDTLAGLRYKGCRTLAWRGRRVAMICLFDGARHLDLFVFESGPVAANGPNGQPQFSRANGLTTATWTQAGHTYLLAAHGDSEPETLRRYL